MVQQEEKNSKTILVATIVTCIIGLIFLMMSLQSFWYKNKIEQSIAKEYNDFTASLEDSIIQDYTKDMSFLASQNEIIQSILSSETTEKRNNNVQLLPVEYFLLHNPSFLSGYIFNAKGTLVKEIAKDTKDTSLVSIPINRELVQTAISKNTIEIDLKNDAIIDIAVPVYNNQNIIGAVIASFSIPIAKAEYVDLLTKKQKAELEKDLFNREEFIYSVTFLACGFLLISIAFLSIYLQIKTGYSLFDRVLRRHITAKPNEEDLTHIESKK